MRRILPFAAAILSLAALSATSRTTFAAVDPNPADAQDESPVRCKVVEKDGKCLAENTVVTGKVCETSADERLSGDILRTIGKVEVQFGGSESPAKLDTRCLAPTASPAKINEVWIVARGKEKIVYTVSLVPSSAGGTDLEVGGPWGTAP